MKIKLSKIVGKNIVPEIIIVIMIIEKYAYYINYYTINIFQLSNIYSEKKVSKFYLCVAGA